ncbi:hypothetical protein MASR2M18_06020 [Ignavibacteria bacterium]|nr:hypothetical protein [Bacteroidota bacterium]
MIYNVTTTLIKYNAKIYPSALKEFEIESIQPNPSGGDNVTIRCRARYDSKNVSINVYTMQGVKIGTVWRGDILRGDATVSIALNNYASGTYTLYFVNNVGQAVAIQKIIVSK